MLLNRTLPPEFMMGDERAEESVVTSLSKQDMIYHFYAMYDGFVTTYSDWRNSAPISACPACGAATLCSRDCPIGIEIECLSCDWREARPWTAEELRNLADRRHGALAANRS